MNPQVIESEPFPGDAELKTAQNFYSKPGMVVHSCNTSTQEAEVE
jgi:hypothetical protein